MGNLKKVKSGIKITHLLKVVFYLLGFPLLLSLVFHDSIKLAGGVMGDGYTAPLYVAAAWGIVVVAQLLFGLLLRKKAAARAVLIAIVAFAVVAGPLMYIKFVVEKKFDAYEEQYKDSDYEFDSYEVQAGKFGKRVKARDSAVNAFLATYNIEYISDVYGSKNTDLTEYTYDPNQEGFFLTGYGGTPHYTFGKEQGDAYYSANGMYADGYIFGYKQASYILKTYYTIKNQYAKDSLDVDVELANAIYELETDASSKWNDYKETEAYQDAYGENGEAKKYYLTEERIDEILDVLKVKLAGVPGLTGLLTVVKGFVPEEYAGLVDLENLNLATLLPVFEGFGLDIMGLLEGLSNYQSPTVYPVFFFIEDEDLRDYAYSKYFAEVHGGKVGSVLVGERVGEVTMDLSGSEPMAEDDLLTFINETDIEYGYMPELYPFLIMLNWMYIFCGVVVASILLSYYFSYNERKLFAQLTLEGGAKA